jgi:5-methylcytosine-specific restriction endonuclease McrA
VGILNRDVLVLNKSWARVRISNVSRCLSVICADRAKIIDAFKDEYPVYTWDEWVMLLVSEEEEAEGLFIRLSRDRKMRVPEVITLTSYNTVPNYRVKYTKANIYRRDNFTCQYTGKMLDKKDLDIDHVIPLAQGGKNDFTNTVVCSKEINRDKADKRPDQTKYRLQRTPRVPTPGQIILDPRKEYPKSFAKFMDMK